MQFAQFQHLKTVVGGSAPDACMLGPFDTCAMLPAIPEEALEESDFSDCCSSDEEDEQDEGMFGEDEDQNEDYDYEGIMQALCGGHAAEGMVYGGGHDGQARVDEPANRGDDADTKQAVVALNEEPQQSAARVPSQKETLRAMASGSYRRLCHMIDSVPRIFVRRHRYKRSHTY